MKVAISANSGDPEVEFSARFGRCKCFLIADPELGDWQEVQNPALDAQGGAGTQVVQFLSNQGVDAVVSGRYGPYAYDALQAAGMEAYLASSGTPRELLSDLKAGRLSTASGPTGEGNHDSPERGVGGRGLGRRGQGGRGRGGRGRGGRGQGGRGQEGGW